MSYSVHRAIENDIDAGLGLFADNKNHGKRLTLDWEDGVRGQAFVELDRCV